MDEFLKALAQLLIRCGETSKLMREQPGSDHLWKDAQVVKDLIPALLADQADRPDGETAALLLLAAGTKLFGVAQATGRYDGGLPEAEKQALALLGIVPLTPAGK